ncbi:MAG: N-acetylmuramoyl-L-alanine amidase [Clostridium lundense]|nr:N-acetylmuramoyl-L-alanine amidase [Clostridium lundense]
MINAIRGGHNYDVPGAKALLDEVTEDRKVYKAVIKYLNIAGEDTIDVTSNIADVSKELQDGVSKANSIGADLFVSIHFNKAYNSYNGAIGTEVWLNPDNAKANIISNRIVNNLAFLGFKNRGLKDGIKEKLYEVRATKMPGIIVEVCFVEAAEDVAIYKSVGPDRIGKAIAEAIIGKAINAPIKEEKVYKVQVGAFKEKGNAEALLKDLKEKGYVGFIV